MRSFDYLTLSSKIVRNSLFDWVLMKVHMIQNPQSSSECCHVTIRKAWTYIFGNNTRFEC